LAGEKYHRAAAAVGDVPATLQQLLINCWAGKDPELVPA
jgi:hypothetical protein